MTVVAKNYTLERIDLVCLHDEIVAADPLPTAGYEGVSLVDSTHVDVFSTIAPTSQELTDLDAAVSGHALRGARAIKCREIDDRTRELIEEGFTHSGKTLSMSQRAQSHLNALGSQLGSSLLVEPGDFPILISSLLDSAAAHSSADIADLKAVVDAYATALQGHIDSGIDLKDDVRAAGTVAAVDAVVDSR